MKRSLLEIRRLRGHYRLAIADLHHGTGFSRAVQAVFGSGVSGFSSDYAKPQRLKSKEVKTATIRLEFVPRYGTSSFGRFFG
jgi:hypothetical protein